MDGVGGQEGQAGGEEGEVAGVGEGTHDPGEKRKAQRDQPVGRQTGHSAAGGGLAKPQEQQHE